MARGPLRISRTRNDVTPTTPLVGTLTLALRATFADGVRSFIEYARAADRLDGRISAIVAEWDRLSRYKRTRVQVEELCAHAGISCGELVGAVARVAWEANQNLTTAMVGFALSQVIQTGLRRACTAKGIAERRMLFRLCGFLPGRPRSRSFAPDARAGLIDTPVDATTSSA